MRFFNLKKELYCHSIIMSIKNKIWFIFHFNKEIPNIHFMVTLIGINNIEFIITNR